MIYYLIRHKATQEFMPQLERGRGYSHWNPAVTKTEEHFTRRKLLGVPRLFSSRKKAILSIAQWNTNPNSYNGYTRNSIVDVLEIQIKDDGRKKEDLEVVEVDIVILGDSDASKGTHS